MRTRASFSAAGVSGGYGKRSGQILQIVLVHIGRASFAKAIVSTMRLGIAGKGGVRETAAACAD
ncbi:MAG: hypothetical protein LBG43_10090 [Treponema sp.]|nr:hypothetical protein [Treponema sp.]